MRNFSIFHYFSVGLVTLVSHHYVIGCVTKIVSNLSGASYDVRPKPGNLEIL